MTNKKIFIIAIIAIIIGISIFIFSISKPPQTTPLILNNKTISDITISTDKNNYNKGEIININVKNGLDESILYSGGGDRFWGIEYFKDNEWINTAYEDGGFQLSVKSPRDDCFIILYEQVPPSELKSQSSISSQWDQKMCPFETGSPAEPRTVKYIENGTYRLIFIYGFGRSDNNPYRISDIKKIYSNSFTIE